MKKLCVLLIMMAVSLCAFSSGIAEATDNANSIMDEVESLLLFMNAQIEAGNLTQDGADQIAVLLEPFISALSDVIDQSGGVVFDGANRTIDNAFAEFRHTLVTVKDNILGGTVDDLLLTLSYEIQNETELLLSGAEDIIVLAFGELNIFVDKTVNSILIIIAVVILAIALIILSVILIKSNLKEIRVGAWIGISFSGLLIVMLSLIIFVTPVRVYLIANFNLGSSRERVVIEPKVTRVYPETFTIGKDERITLHGRHLGKINFDTVKVGLYKGNNQQKTFTADSIIVTPMKVVLSGLSGSAGVWQLPNYSQFEGAVLKPLASKPSEMQLILLDAINKTDLQENVKSAILNKIRSTDYNESDRLKVIAAQLKYEDFSDPKTVSFVTKMFGVNADDFKSADAITLNAATRKQLELSNSFFQKHFNIPSGDYGIRLFDANTFIENQQLITLQYPEPPAPKPDLYVISADWHGPGIYNEKNIISARVGILHPENIAATVSVTLRSTNNTFQSKTVQLNQGDINQALQTGFLDVLFTDVKAYSITNNRFKIVVDYDADGNTHIEESDETNNGYSMSLDASKYIYDVTVFFDTFIPRQNKDESEDEYRLKLEAWLVSNNKTRFDFDKDGDPGDSWDINKSVHYPGLKEGDKIYFSVSGYEEDNPGFPLFDDHDSLGSQTDHYTLVKDSNGIRQEELLTAGIKIQMHLEINRKLDN